MANYIIDGKNGNGLMIDPIIEVLGLAEGNPRAYPTNYLTKKYKADIKLTLPNGSWYIHTLEDIQAESMNMEQEGAKMPQQVLTALNEQFGVEDEEVQTKNAKVVVEEPIVVKKSLLTKTLELF